MMCPACLRAAGGARAGRWKFLRSPSSAARDPDPPMTSSPIPAARSQYLLDLLAQVPGPRKRRGRRHALAGLLAVGISAVIAGSRSFAAIGQWAADAGPEVLAGLGAARGPAEESTFRRAFALVSADVLDGVLGAWLWTRAVRAGGRLVIAIDGKTVRGAKSEGRKAPHLVAALAHGIGAVLGQVAVDEKPNEIPVVQDLLRAFASLAGAVVTIDALCGRPHNASLGYPFNRSNLRVWISLVPVFTTRGLRASSRPGSARTRTAWITWNGCGGRVVLPVRRAVRRLPAR
jgi:hypothetical protein